MVMAPNRWAARQQRLFARLERKAFRRVRAEIVRASKEIIRVYSITGEVHQARDHFANIESIYLEMAQNSISASEDEFAKQFKALGLRLETKQDANTWATEYIQGELMRERIVDVTDTTRQRIVQGVLAGYEQGLGQRGTAEEILRRVPEMSVRRAAVIARTETHGAANYGAHKQAQTSKFPMKKVWLAGEDNRTRRVPRDAFDHFASDGQEVGLNDPFLIPTKSGGVEALQYPGDPAGSAGNIINCRCSMAHRIDVDIDPDDIFAGLEL